MCPLRQGFAIQDQPCEKKEGQRKKVTWKEPMTEVRLFRGASKDPHAAERNLKIKLLRLGKKKR